MSKYVASQDPPPSSRPDEISNISGGVFRRENNQQLNLNEYFAKNLNLTKLSSTSNHHHDKMGIGLRNGGSTSSSFASSASLRQMLPILLCLFTFASVLSMLIIYIDTTEIRHQQFRLNMSRDYDVKGISQDNPVLVSYLREMHLKKYVQEPLFNHIENEGTPPSIATSKLTREMAEFVVTDLLQRKEAGTFIQSSIGASSDDLMIAPYLVEQYMWRGMFVEPDPKKYFNYGRIYGASKDVRVVHACFSPTGFPKEVTLHQEGGLDTHAGMHGEEEAEEVKISSVLDGEEEMASDWFENRVKCFPLFTLMLAVNQTELDLLSLSLHGLELQILKTLPFDRVRINVISLHFAHLEDLRSNYIQTVTRFLTFKGFKLMKVVGHSYFYKTKRGMKRMLP